MRDPDRIPKILKEIEKIWVKFPDLRLGQLLINVFDAGSAFAHVSLYNLEDDKLVEQLEARYKDMQYTRPNSS